jgi:hypothetical protein
VAGVAGLGTWVAVDAVAARTALEQAAGAIPDLEQRLRTSPDDAAADHAPLQESTGEAARRTQGVHWTIAGMLPVVGDDVRALATIADTADSLATDVLPSMTAAAQAVTPERLAPQDGRVDLTAFQEVRRDVVRADATVGAAADRIAGISRGGLITPLADAADELQSQLGTVRATTATAARAVELLPPMLGADGPRDWLVLAQNNAEQRATGGIPGAVLHVRADDGELTFEGKASTSDLPVFDAPVLEPTPSERALFGDGLGRWIQNVNFTPDFPRTAQLASTMWTERMGGEPQGVLSVDPVLLQSLLSATGPVTFEDPTGERITLTDETAAHFLMAEIYARYPEPRVQDEVFAAAAEAVFEALTTGDVDAGLVVDALADGARDGRVMVWSSHDDEQARLAGTVLSGELRGMRPTADGLVAPKAGVFLNMTTSGKTGYHLDMEYVVEDVVLRADGSQEFDLRVTLTNRLKPGQAARLPDYVIGDGPADGTIRQNVLAYAPKHGAVRGVTSADGDPLDVFVQEHDGHAVAVRAVAVAPGETQELVFRMVSGPEQRGEIQVRHTPGARLTHLWPT